MSTEFCSSHNLLFPVSSRRRGLSSRGEALRSKSETTESATDILLTLAFWKPKLLQGIMLQRGERGQSNSESPPNEQEVYVCMDKWGPQTLPNDALGVGQDGLEKRGSWPLRSQSGHLSRHHVNHRIKHTGPLHG